MYIEKNSYKFNPIYIFIFFLVMLSSLIILGNRTSYGLMIIVLLILLFLIYSLRISFEVVNKYLLFFTIASLPFPFFIQYAGKDAITITTLLIFVLFFSSVLSSLLMKKNLLKGKSEIFLLILIFISYSASLVFNKYLFEQSFKYYLANISGIIFFIIILKLVKTKADFITVFKLIVFLLMIQSVITFIQIKFPEFHKVTGIFRGRSYIPHLPLSLEGIARPKGTVGDFELLAEWFLLGCLLSLALIYIQKNYIYLITFLSCTAGIIFTKTRSDLMLLIFALLLIILILRTFKKDYDKLSIKILFAIIISFTILIIVFPSEIEDFIYRFKRYFTSSSLISVEAFNRKIAWDSAKIEVMENLNFFGNGFHYILVPVNDSFEEFHSLYLTLLYKVGFFGFIIHLLFWATLIFKSGKKLIAHSNSSNWHFIFFLLIAVIIILLDQIKIEYLRWIHTIQFAWMIFALLASSLNLEHREK